MPDWMKLTKKDFSKILENYDLGDHTSHKHLEHALGNTVYILQTTKGKFILKIYFPETTKRLLNFQIRLVNYLSERGELVPRFLMTRSGDFWTKYTTRKVTLQPFLTGRHPVRFSEPLLRDLARKIIQLHQLLLDLDIRGGISADKEYQFKLSDPEGPFPLFDEVFGLRVREEYERYLSLAKTLDRRKLRKCIVHRDITPDNILVDQTKLVAFLDFDDSARDYFAYDLAVMIAHTFVTHDGISDKNFRTFLRYYTPPIELTGLELTAIYYFIKHRQICAICWAEVHRRDGAPISDWTKDWVGRYRAFDKISLEKFTTYFEVIKTLKKLKTELSLESREASFRSVPLAKRG